MCFGIEMLFGHWHLFFGWPCLAESDLANVLGQQLVAPSGLGQSIVNLQKQAIAGPLKGRREKITRKWMLAESEAREAGRRWRKAYSSCCSRSRSASPNCCWSWERPFAFPAVLSLPWPFIFTFGRPKKRQPMDEEEEWMATGNGR